MADRSLERVRQAVRHGTLLSVAALLLAGCKFGGDQATTQVAARVNSDEITIHQVNDVLARVPPQAPENAARVKREVLDRLINEQIGVQQALSKKLDTTPAVVAAIESARREILFRAYLNSVSESQDKPDDATLKKYYQDHPELFRDRRIYQLELIEVPQPGTQDKVREAMASAKSMADVANGLKARGIVFSADAGVRTAEQLPIPLLPEIAQLKDGQIAMLSKGDHPTVVHLIGSKSEPVDEARALPAIRQFLVNQRGTQAAEKAMAELRGSAKIEYLGEFSADAKPAPAAAPAAAAKPAPAAGGVDAGAIERGVSGLK